MPPVKGVGWMKIVNKISFEHGAPSGVNEYRAPHGVISAFYKFDQISPISKEICISLQVCSKASVRCAVLFTVFSSLSILLPNLSIDLSNLGAFGVCGVCGVCGVRAGND